MKSSVSIFLIVGFFALSCDDDEPLLYTGEITVVASNGVTEVDGVPVSQLNVGLFDMNVLVTERYWILEAISAKKFDQGKVEFKELNPGNYVVALTTSSGFRRTVQVTVGKTTTVSLF